MLPLFDISMKARGLPMAAARRAYAAEGQLPIDARLALQERLKWQLLRHHSQRNRFYQRHTGGATFYRWADVPIITKRDQQCPLDERLARGYDRWNIYVGKTSGSSGHPFVFGKSLYSHARTWALIQERYARHGIDLNRDLQARFYGIPLSGLDYRKEKLKDWLACRERFPIFDLSDPILEGYASRFDARQFRTIYGYASSLVLFARYLERQGMVLRDRCPSLHRCITTSEVCSPEDRKTLERAFGVPTVNEYGAAEATVLAIEDEHFDWIVSEEEVFIEVVDEQNQPVPPGRPGRALVTLLHNRATPIIRYEVGDVIRLAPERKGFHRVLERVEGRTNDVATLPSGKKSPGLTFYYISKSLMDQVGGMREFVIHQLEPDLFHYIYIADNALSEAQQNDVRALMDEYLEPGLRATFERVSRIDRTGAGKLKQFRVMPGAQ